MRSLFAFLRKEAPTLQLYGKLPLAKDYLRIGMAEGSALRFRDWLDKAFSGQVGGHAPRLAWSGRFVLGEAWGEPLQGLAWPSVDAGHKRPFPFVLCVERRQGALIEDMDHALVEAEALWRAIAGVYVEAVSQADGQAALGVVRGRSLTVEPDPALATTSVDVNHWLGALWPAKGERAEPTDGFFGDLERLEELAGDASRPPLRLPLVDNLPVRPQVDVWLEVLRRLGLLGPEELPTLFFPVSGRRGEDARTAGFLTVFRKAPDIRDAAWLLDPAEGAGRLGPGDLCDGRPRLLEVLEPASENVPPLRASVKGMVMRFVARSRA